MPEVAPEIPEFLTLLSRTAGRRVIRPASGGFERPAPENQFSGDAPGIIDPTSPQFWVAQNQTPARGVRRPTAADRIDEVNRKIFQNRIVNARDRRDGANLGFEAQRSLPPNKLRGNLEPSPGD
jgi:hypothetical protein